mgnify:CR=1 FL=1
MSILKLKSFWMFLIVVGVAACAPKKKQPQFYVEPGSVTDKTNLEQGKAYKGLDGKEYLPVTSLETAPKAAPGFEAQRTSQKPYQSIDGKNYYFPAKAFAELGIAPPKETASVSTELTEEQKKLPVAEVNSSIITVGELSEKINARPPAWRRMYASDDKKEEFLNTNIIQEMLLYDAAKAAKLEDDPVVKDAAEKRMVDILRRDKITEIRKNLNVTEEDMKKYYEENKEQFVQPEGLIAAQIVVKTKTEADKLYKELIAETNEAARSKLWRDMVEKYTIDMESKDRGGLLGDEKHRAVTKDDPAFDKAIVNALWSIKEDNAISLPVQTAKGWHILRRYNLRKAINIDFEQAKPRLQRLVERDMITRQYQEWVNQLKTQYGVKEFPENLKFVTVDLTEETHGDDMHKMPVPPVKP